MIHECIKCNSDNIKILNRYYLDDKVFYNAICLNCAYIHEIDYLTWI